MLSFVTYWRSNRITCLRKVGFFFISLIFIMPLVSCGAHSWYSIEQTPATPIAYLRDGVFVSGDYVRSALIAEIDGKSVLTQKNHLVEVAVGKHQVKVFCNEAEGEYNSEEFVGQAKTLEFEARIQRKVSCRLCALYTLVDRRFREIISVVAGERYN